MPLTLSPATLPEADTIEPYLVFLEAGGAEAPYDFSLYAGRLPLGLSLAVDGSISGGRAWEAGTFNFTVKIVSSDGVEGGAPLTLKVNDPNATPSELQIVTPTDVAPPAPPVEPPAPPAEPAPVAPVEPAAPAEGA